MRIKVIKSILVLLCLDSGFAQTTEKTIPDSVKKDKAQLENLFYQAEMFLNTETDITVSLVLQAAELAMEYRDTNSLIYSYSLLGEAYYSLNQIDISKEYFQKQMELSEETGNKSFIADAHNNLGIICRREGNLYDAMRNYHKALDLNESIKDTLGMSSSLNNIGVLNFRIGEYEEAAKFYKRSLSLDQQTNNTSGMATSYLNLGEVYSYQKRYSLSSNFLKKAEKLASEINDVVTLEIIHETYYNMYKSSERYKLALEHFEKYKNIHDARFTKEYKMEIARQEVQFKTKEKDQRLELLNKEQALTQLELTNQELVVENQRILLILSALAFGILVFFIANILKSRKIIRHKAEELEDKNEEILQQKEEIETQKNVAIEQRDRISYQNEKITDSILYAEKIQKVILSDPKLLHPYTDSSFIIYKPKDIVSGDFYFFKEDADNLFIAVADCTGHGVPGAFMSVLGTTLLNEILMNASKLDTGDILDALRYRLKKVLNQHDNVEEAKDGMDLGLLKIDKKKNEIQLSLAYQYALHISDGKMNVMKGDKMPIGLHYLEKPFKTHHLDLKKGDQFYLFSDGFMDQLGGDLDRKYMCRNMWDFIHDISSKDLNQQKNILEKEFENWKGHREQTDDVIILGVKI